MFQLVVCSLNMYVLEHVFYKQDELCVNLKFVIRASSIPY